MKKLLLTAFAALAFPIAAHAVTVAPGDTVTQTDLVLPDSDVSFTFEIDSALDLTGFSLIGLGDSDDISSVGFEITTVSGVTQTGTFADGFIFPEDAAVASGFVDGPLLRLFGGDIVTVFFAPTDDGIGSPVAVATTLSTAEVPLPAAGGMLLTGLVAAGFVARRKKKQAA